MLATMASATGSTRTSANESTTCAIARATVCGRRPGSRTYTHSATAPRPRYIAGWKTSFTATCIGAAAPFLETSGRALTAGALAAHAHVHEQAADEEQCEDDVEDHVASFQEGGLRPRIIGGATLRVTSRGSGIRQPKVSMRTRPRP